MIGLSSNIHFWIDTFATFHTHYLRMRQSSWDFSLFFRMILNQLVALYGTDKDNVMQACIKDLKEEIGKQPQTRLNI